jgi:hypothetical protein
VLFSSEALVALEPSLRLSLSGLLAGATCTESALRRIISSLLTQAINLAAPNLISSLLGTCIDSIKSLEVSATGCLEVEFYSGRGQLTDRYDFGAPPAVSSFSFCFCS